MQQLLTVAAKLGFAWLVAFPILWINDVLSIRPGWSLILLIGVALTAVPASFWQRLPRLSVTVWQGLLFGLLVVGSLVGQTAVLRFHPVFTAAYLITWLFLFSLSYLYRQSDAVSKLALITFGLMLALILTNVGAGFVLAQLDQNEASQPLVKPTATETPSTGQNPQTAEDHAQANDDGSPTPTPTAVPTATPTITNELPLAVDQAQPAIDVSPTPTRPIAGFGYLEWLQDNGEAPWTNLTAYGPRINSIAHATMYDDKGEVVYDTLIEYNGKGYRGPEVTYEKPKNVYRILIIGDSFVEAIQVPYEQTFQARLQAQLNRHNSADRRYEVVAMGRTGWGTMHEVAYYQVEGHKYNADLVILMFYINDVADNLPRVFYPNINDTNYDYVLNEGRVQIVDTNQQPLPPRNGRLLYNALHWRLRETDVAKLFVRLADPPVPIITPGGVMTRVHPQFYIYVAEPAVEGYPKGWQRTAELLQILAEDVDRDGGQLAVMPIFLGSELVSNVSGWFPELVVGWHWDDSLPERHLAEILADTPAYLWPTRPTFEAYAREVGREVYNLLYLPEDGHFNMLGHQLTYEAIYDWLLAAGIVEE